jgi:CheY-like chemotaxis protein
MGFQTDTRACLECARVDHDENTQARCSETSVAVVIGFDHGLLKLVRTLLEELGIEAYKEEPTEGVVPTVARLQPCVIIIDVDFVHEAPTLAALRALKEDPATGDIPVVACAAAPWLLEQQNALLERGAVRTWTEPYDPLELLRTIDAAVSENLPHCEIEQPTEVARAH